MNRLPWRIGLVVALIVGFGALLPSGAYADCSETPDVQTSGDACSSAVAVSVMGDASGQGCSGPVSCVSVSGSKDASNTASGDCGVTGAGCVAVSGTGSASNSTGPGSQNGGCGGFVGAGCVAVSGTGNASNTVAGPRCGNLGVGCVAVSGTGSASNTILESGDGGCGALGVGCAAASGTGDASNTVGPGDGFPSQCSRYIGVGCVAVSGTGNASNTVPGGQCGYGAVGCVAASGTGDASNAVSSGCGETAPFIVGVPVPGAGCVAASGTGSASNDYGQCETGCVAVVLTNPMLMFLIEVMRQGRSAVSLLLQVVL